MPLVRDRTHTALQSAVVAVLLALSSLPSGHSTSQPPPGRLGRHALRKHGAADPKQGPLPGAPRTVQERTELLAFVGVFTAVEPQRRNVLRDTWFQPRATEALAVRMRFVVGRLEPADQQAQIAKEAAEHGDFYHLDMDETYDNLVVKAYTYVVAIFSEFDARYIIKLDDDLYFRFDRLPQAIQQWQAAGGDYVGVMRVGSEAFEDPKHRYHEPNRVLHNGQYYMYASGAMYALSANAAGLIASIPLSKWRISGGGDDSTMGLWMLAHNMTYFDDRRIGQYVPCSHNFLVVTGPCNGLCDAVTQIPLLHKDPNCTAPGPTVLPQEPSWYDLRATRCIRLVDGKVDKSRCREA
ncbi:hypothetical protein WJX72_005724 [[Myrmecia] bisecta]|uniref:Hexosyltransferase n=1 Tax=[Myrmecia] bisecta TaxID=41462 RepID=A0AAW1QRE6_9CHLO